MRTGISVFAAVLFLLTIAGCAYTHVRTPLDINLDQTRLGTKSGRASAQSVLWLAAWGDASYAAAARNGGIAVMNHADQETLVILFGLYVRQTTIVYGE